MSCNSTSSTGPTIIQCKSNTTQTIVTFLNNSFTILKGSTTFVEVLLNSYQEVVTNYTQTTSTLVPGDSITLSYSGIGDSDGNVKVLAVFSTYVVGSPCSESYLEWKFDDGILSTPYQSTGPILILTGQEEHLIQPLIIRNPITNTNPISIKVIAAA